MVLTVKLGATVIARIQGHSAVNGAKIPETAAVTMTSNDSAVAGVPSSVPVPTGGAEVIDVPVSVLGLGSTDIGVTVRTADGVPYEATATLIVEAAPLPGLVRVSLELVQQ